MLLFLLLTRLLQIMPVLVDGEGTVCIRWSSIFILISLIKTKNGKQWLHRDKEEKSAAPGICPHCLMLWCLFKAAQSNILAQSFSWVSPAMTLEHTDCQPGTISEPLDGRKFQSSNSKVCGSTQIFCYRFFARLVFKTSCRFNEMQNKKPWIKTQVWTLEANRVGRWMIHKLELQRIKNFKELKCIFSKGSNYNTSWKNSSLCRCLIKASKQAHFFSQHHNQTSITGKTLTFFSLTKWEWKKVPQQLVSFLGLGTSSKAPWTHSSSAGLVNWELWSHQWCEAAAKINPDANICKVSVNPATCAAK